MHKQNLNEVLYLFVKELKIPITSHSINLELERHPEYNSLMGASDVLNNWRVPNAAYNLNFEELIAAEISDPFIAYLANQQFVLVHNLNREHAIISDELVSRKKLPVGEFKKQYRGTILVADKDENSGEVSYKLKKKLQLVASIRTPMILCGFLLVTTALIGIYSSGFSSPGWQNSFLILLKLLGLCVTILLLIQSIDSNNPLIQKLCVGNAEENCNAILTSKSAMIGHFLSWSEVGFFYFAGTLLTLIFNLRNESVIDALAILNLLCLPYTFYSIFYQWRIAKQWCRFCCAVQALLWLEFFAFSHYLSKMDAIPALKNWGPVLVFSLIPVLFWYFLKPYFLSSIQIGPLKDQLKKFKYNADIFNKMLQSEVRYALPAAENTLIIGNPRAEQTVTMVSNPFCQPCSRTHKALNEWMTVRDDIKLQIVFVTGKSDNDAKKNVVNHLMTLQVEADQETLKTALDRWYEQQNQTYEAWAKLYPVAELKIHTSILEKQNDWCNLVEVSHTPALFINGRKLPAHYQPEDIKYFF